MSISFVSVRFTYALRRQWRLFGEVSALEISALHMTSNANGDFPQKYPPSKYPLYTHQLGHIQEQLNRHIQTRNHERSGLFNPLYKIMG